MSGGQFFLYLLLLGLIFSLGIFGSFARQLYDVSNDVQELNEVLPSFSIQEGQLQTEDPEVNSLIYQSDTFLFFFDPNEEMNQEVVDSNSARLNVPISVALLKDEAYVTSDFSQYALPYNESVNFDYQEGSLESIVSWQNLALVSIMALALYFILAFLNVVITSLISSVFALLIARIMQVPLSFMDTWKSLTSAMTLPIIIFSVLNLFGIIIPFQTNIMGFLTILLFVFALHNYKKKHF